MSSQDDPDVNPQDSTPSGIGRKFPLLSEVKEKKPAGYNAVAVDDDATPRTKLEYPRRKSDISTLLTDLAAVTLPLAMIAFVIAVMRLNGTQVAENSHGSWMNAITVVSTSAGERDDHSERC